MPAARSHRYSCHWGYIDGPEREGHVSRTLMWICEYPYRTVRASGPDESCDECPVYKENPGPKDPGSHV
jgi:hypothetical protein